MKKLICIILMLVFAMASSAWGGTKIYHAKITSNMNPFDPSIDYQVITNSLGLDVDFNFKIWTDHGGGFRYFLFVKNPNFIVPGTKNEVQSFWYDTNNNHIGTEEEMLYHWYFGQSNMPDYYCLDCAYGANSNFQLELPSQYNVVFDWNDRCYYYLDPNGTPRTGSPVHEKEFYITILRYVSDDDTVNQPGDINIISYEQDEAGISVVHEDQRNLVFENTENSKYKFNFGKHWERPKVLPDGRLKCYAVQKRTLKNKALKDSNLKGRWGRWEPNIHFLRNLIRRIAGDKQDVIWAIYDPITDEIQESSEDLYAE